MKVNHNIEWLQNEDGSLFGYRHRVKGDVQMVQSVAGKGGAVSLVPSDTAGFSAAAARRSNILSFKPFGNIPQYYGTNYQRTWMGKFEVEADFDAVRIIMLNYQTANAIVGTKILVGCTETAAIDTASHLFDPISGGVVDQSVDSTADRTGWRTIKWAGSTAMPSLSASSTAFNPSAGVGNVGVSDWTPLKSIPRADGGSRPLVMVRLYHDGVANGVFALSQYGTQPDTSVGARGRVMQFANYAGDAIATPAFNSGALGGVGHMPYIIQFRSRSRVISVVSIGDSITQLAPIVPNMISSTAYRATADAVDNSGVAAMHSNCGAYAHNTTDYWSAGRTVMDLMAAETATSICGSYPDVAVYSPWSPNNNISTSAPVSRYNLQNTEALLGEFLAYCTKNRIWPVLWTGIPYEVLTAAEDTERQNYNALIRSMSGKCTIVDFDVLLGNGATPEQWANGAYRFEAAGSGLHPSEAGVEYLATAGLSPALSALFANLK